MGINPNTMGTDCVRLRRDNICRLDLKPCREGCPLRKTQEEIEEHKKNRN